jgi:hypothetical protein
MANDAIVSGPSQFAKRVDKNKYTQIEDMASGKYGDRKSLRETGAGASMDVPTVQVGSPLPAVPVMKNVPATAPSNESTIMNGVNAGDGSGPESIIPPIDSPDAASILARAMYLANPSPQTRRNLEAFYAEGR